MYRLRHDKRKALWNDVFVRIGEQHGSLCSDLQAKLALEVQSLKVRDVPSTCMCITCIWAMAL